MTNKAESELIYLRVLRHDIGTAGAGARTVHIYNKQQTMLWLDYCAFLPLFSPSPLSLPLDWEREK